MTSFDLMRPDRWASGVIFGSPHSGRDYPDWFVAQSGLGLDALRSSEDAFVDRLIASAPAHGAVALVARTPRAVVDLNRGCDEIDPVIIRDTPRRPLNQRTLSGLGVIPRVVSRGQVIRTRVMSRAEADALIDAHWRPYHAALTALIAQARARFGQAIVIDMHSMPSDSVSGLPGPRPDMVLGNRHGQSASAAVTDAVAAALGDQGWRVRRNTPFAGAYITQAYGCPARNVHVIQIEIDRGLYMDETAIAPHIGFAGFAARMDRAVARMAQIGPFRNRRPVAAE